MKKEETVLFKFLDYYFNNKDEYIESSRDLAERFGCSRAKVKTIIDHFSILNYIYRTPKNLFKVNKFKKSFNPDFKIVTKDDFYYVENKDYRIWLNQFEVDSLIQEYEIGTIDDINDLPNLFFIYFSLNLNYIASVKGLAYLENDEVWFRRECYYKHSESPLYISEYTQHSDELVFGGK